MSVKNPHAAQVSKVLGAKARGWTVTQERGQHIDFSLNQSVGARFPVTLVTWKYDEGTDTADKIVEKLKDAGYHAEPTDIPTGTLNRVMRRAVIVRSQEDLDDRTARRERAANADTVAEKLVPTGSRVKIQVTTYPDHSKRTSIQARADVVAMVTESLREPITDVMNADDISRECLTDWDLFPLKERMAGLRTRIHGKHATVLLIPVDDEPDETPAIVYSDDDPHATEGTVIPAGHTLGIPAEYADNNDARDAYAALTAAGHTPALLANQTDDDDNDTAHGTGFMIHVRTDEGARVGRGLKVLVGHLVDGVDAWNSLPDTDRRKTLRGYRDTLRAAGWETDIKIMGRRLHAWRTSPLPEGVTVEQTQGEYRAACRIELG